MQTLSGLFSEETDIRFRTNTATGANTHSNLDWTQFLRLCDLDAEWTAATVPVVASTPGGTPPTITGAVRYRKLGSTVRSKVTITVTANGTGSGNLQATLPVEGEGVHIMMGRDATTGAVVVGVLFGSTLVIQTVAGAYPAAAGSAITISGSYEAAA